MLDSDVLQIETPRAFLPLLGEHRFKGAKGGRGGAKSHFFAELTIEECLAGHQRVACIREYQSSIRESVKQLLEDKIDHFGVADKFKITDREIVGPHESLIIFKGLRSHTATSIKSLEGFTRGWVEEAQTISQFSLELLTPTFRSNSQLLFSWNPYLADDPVDAFFAENVDDPDFACITCTYKDNPWFPEELRRDMERDRRRDPDKYKHVWLGGYVLNSESRVFRNWRIEDISDQIGGARPYYGADWGFSVDPTVLVRVYVLGRTLYVDREVYKVGCEIDATPALFDGIDDGEARSWPITADSARPETISYMQRHGYPHIQGARKGPGSIEDGVEFLKSYDIVVHPDCKHVIDELTYYSYKTDRLTGDVLPVLEDKKNHVIDALRYGTEGFRMFDGGTVFDVPERDVITGAIKLYPHWKRVWALDIERGVVSVIFGSWDEDSDIVYLYAEYNAGGDIAVQADAVRQVARWIPGVFHPQARSRTKEQGVRLTDRLIDLKLDIFVAEADTEASIQEMQGRLSTARLKVFSSCTGWIHQYRAWRRDKDGKIIDEHDGLMRATGLLLMQGLQIALDDEVANEDIDSVSVEQSRDEMTGY